MKHLARLGSEVDGYGFDLSWSRVAYAKRWATQHGARRAALCTGSLMHIPFADDSIDVVYTSHTIEPNRGREEPILKELFRVTRRFLVLLEPAYELASAEARQRMDSHSYCRNLKGVAESLGYEVLEHKLFALSASAMNPTALTVIRKETAAKPPADPFACPRFRTPLRELGGMLVSDEALVVYPILAGIPCLRIENGIVASKYEEFVGP
jgi:SAM-dependent methyltransferase